LARHGVRGVTEISVELSVHKSTVSRLLATLQAGGLVEHAPGRGRYRLGDGVVHLAQGVRKRHDLAVVSRPVCNELAADVGETVVVVVHEDRNVVTVDQVVGASAVTTVNWVGQRHPLHATSSGKVFMASMPVVELQSYVQAEMTRFTHRTLTDPGQLEKELAAVREHGFARSMEEQEVGLAAIAAPIRSLHGEVIAALAVTGPAFRIHELTIPGIAERLLVAAAQISERNGYPKAG
jgi:DNA-binding IclR family transcriptional regulator